MTPANPISTTPSHSNDASGNPHPSSSASTRELHNVSIEQRALRLQGKERFEFLYKRKARELDEQQSNRTTTETKLLALPATRQNEDTRKSYEVQLVEIDVSITVIKSDLRVIKRRIKESQEQTPESVSTPLRSHTATNAPFASITAASSPVPYRYDPFVSSTAASAAPVLTPMPGLTDQDDDSDSDSDNTLANPNQFRVPSDLPKFRNGDKSLTEVTEFTREFEVQLRAHGIKINSAWNRLLPLCFTPEMQEWLDNNYAPKLKWKVVRDSLHRHFGNPTRRRAAISQLYHASRRHDESIVDFMQRYIQLMRKAQADTNNPELVEYLLEQLPSEIAVQLESGVQYGKIRRNVIDMEAYARTFPSVYNRVPSSTNSRTSTSSKSSKMRLYCDYHGKCGHTTKQCRAKSTSALKSYSSRTHQSSPSSNSTPTSIPPSKAKCYVCDKIGHYANNCPTRKSKGKETARRVDLDKGQADTSTRPSAYEVPIKVNNHSTMALVDTGASISLITKALAKELDLQIHPAEGRLNMAIPGFEIPRIGYASNVELVYGNSTLSNVQLEVVPDLNGPPVFLGEDTLACLDLPINGLPFRPKDAISISEATIDPIVPVVEASQSSDSPDELTQGHLKSAMEAIQPELEANSAISPLEPCPLEMAIVRLDTPEGRVTHKRQFPIAERMRPVLQEAIDQWLEEGVVTRVTEPTKFNTPIFPIPKKDPSGARTLCRPCMDYRELNALTESDKYPLPLISDIFEALRGSRYFTALDLKSAYHRFPVLKEHQHKTAFTWNDVQYKFLRAPFGLKNLPSQFQRVIHYVFQDCPFVRAFIDDAIVFSPDWDTHVKHVKAAIQRLNDAKLILNVEKCHFFKTSLVLLGFRVDAYGHSIDTEHIRRASNWPQPSTGRQVQAFLGFVNYFREHLPMASKLTAPLDTLRNLKRITAPDWTLDCQQSFDKLKEILFYGPALAYPDFNNTFLVATDASKTGIGAVLYQEDPESKKRRYVSFQARSLTKSERNYSATKRELLAIVFALRKFHRYLWGTHFELYTDHRALVYLHSQQNLSPMLAGWYDLIFDYDFTVFHRPGIQNILPDSLSRFFPDTPRQLASTSEAPTIRTMSPADEVQPELQVVRLNNRAFIPTKAYPDDAGFDLYTPDKITIPRQNKSVVKLGIAAAPPPGCYLRIADRSSMAISGITVHGSVVDPSYTGEIAVILYNHNDFDKPFIRGHKIAQIIPEKISFPRVVLRESVQDLHTANPTSRGSRGFGSSDTSDAPPQRGSENYPTASSSSPTPSLSSDNSSDNDDWPDLNNLEHTKYDMPPGVRSVTIRSTSKSRADKEFSLEERKQLLQQQHEMGHFGAEAVVQALKSQNIQWPNMHDEAKKICGTCIQCLRYNIAKRGYHPLKPIIANEPFDHIAVDLAGPFPTSRTQQHWLLVIIDIHSRFVILRTLPDKSGPEVAQALLRVFFDFGFPRIIQSDNGTEFVNQVVKEMTKSAGIDHRLITPYHPRANGSAERTVQTAKRLILKLIKGIKKDWSLFVPFAQYCINIKIAQRTKTAPFVAMFGRQPNGLSDHTNVKPTPLTEENMERHANFMRKVLFPAIYDATQRVTAAVKERFDSKHKMIDIALDTYVMIVDETRSRKTDPANEGPFKVIRRTKGGSYELEDLEGQRLPRNYKPSALIPINDFKPSKEPSYEVEKVIGHHYGNNNETEYKVRWKGYSSHHDTWEPFDNFDSVKAIDEYWLRLGDNHKDKNVYRGRRFRHRPRVSKFGRE